MDIGYPNEYDKGKGYTGNYIMIHGGDRSNGCFAMSDQGIEEIYVMVEAAFRNGVRQIDFHSFPFPLTVDNLNVFPDSPWREFWLVLKKGYDSFERSHIPPTVEVRNLEYYISDYY